MSERHSKLIFTAVLLLAGCAHHAHLQPKTPVAAIPYHTRIKTAAGAIAVVRSATERRGGDPNTFTYHVSRSGDQWFVKAYSMYPDDHTHSSRWILGPFTDYTISSDGKIIDAIPGI